MKPTVKQIVDKLKDNEYTYINNSTVIVGMFKGTYYVNDKGDEVSNLTKERVIALALECLGDVDGVL